MLFPSNQKSAPDTVSINFDLVPTNFMKIIFTRSFNDFYIILHFFIQWTKTNFNLIKIQSAIISRTHQQQCRIIQV
jgi:hypothetical protein